MWPHVRALLVLVHVVAITLMALPAPGSAMKRSAWKDPTVQAEFAAWHARLEAVGLTLTEPEFEDRVWELATAFEATRKRILAPFDPYYRFCGTYQSWRMFVAPHRFPARLHIDLDRGDGEFVPIYVERSDAFGWNRVQLDHDRMRSAIFRYSWSSYAGSYKAFAVWVARSAAADFPDASRVRIRYQKYRTPSPEEVLGNVEVPSEFVIPIVHSLTRLRGPSSRDPKESP